MISSPASRNSYGPGVAEMAHRRDEYCPVANLEPAYRNLAAFLGDPA